MKKVGFSLLVLIFLNSCSSSWVNVKNGKNVEQSKITQALKECDYEEKRRLAGFYFVQANYSEGNSDEVKAEFQKMSDAKFKEIEDCMQKKGLKR